MYKLHIPVDNVLICESVSAIGRPNNASMLWISTQANDNIIRVCVGITADIKHSCIESCLSSSVYAYLMRASYLIAVFHSFYF